MKEPDTPDPSPVSLWTGELTPKEIDLVLQQAEDDPQASAELELACELARWAQDAPHQRAAPRALAWRAWLAAGVVLLVAGLWWMRTPHQGPAEPWIPAPPRFVVLQLRGAADPLGTAFSAAMESYPSGDFERTLEALTLFLERHPDHGPAHFYRGACLDQLGRFQEAQRSYAETAQRSTGFLSERARWHWALSALAAGDRPQALERLAQLIAEDGEFAANARELSATLGD